MDRIYRIRKRYIGKQFFLLNKLIAEISSIDPAPSYKQSDYQYLIVSVVYSREFALPEHWLDKLPDICRDIQTYFGIHARWMGVEGFI